MRASKNIRQDYKTNVYNLSEIKINPFANNIQNYKSKFTANGHRQTATVNYEI
jgi:hypothetical protein